MVKQHRHILAVVAVDAPSVVALRRAFAMSQLFRAQLHVVVPLEIATPPLVENEDRVRRDIVGWAASKAKIVLARKVVRVALGDASAIEHAAAAEGATLIVVGAPLSTAPSRLVLASMDAASARACSLLLACPPRSRHEVIAATDLRDSTCRVVTTAARFAGALAARVTVVHAVEDDRPCELEAERLSQRLRRLERLAGTLDGVRAGHLATTTTAAEAIRDVAENRDADIAVVGVRRGHGRTLCSLLDRTKCSVLAIPLD